MDLFGASPHDYPTDEELGIQPDRDYFREWPAFILWEEEYEDCSCRRWYEREPCGCVRTGIRACSQNGHVQGESVVQPCWDHRC
jgi:hypothetical protein